MTYGVASFFSNRAEMYLDAIKDVGRMGFASYSNLFFVENAVTTRLNSCACGL